MTVSGVEGAGGKEEGTKQFQTREPGNGEVESL